MYPAASIWILAPTVIYSTAYLVAAFRTLTVWLPRDPVDRSVPLLAPGQTSWWRRPVARHIVAAALASIVIYAVVATSI